MTTVRIFLRYCLRSILKCWQPRFCGNCRKYLTNTLENHNFQQFNFLAIKLQLHFIWQFLFSPFLIEHFLTGMPLAISVYCGVTVIKLCCFMLHRKDFLEENFTVDERRIGYQLINVIRIGYLLMRAQIMLSVFSSKR